VFDFLDWFIILDCRRPLEQFDGNTDLCFVLEVSEHVTRSLPALCHFKAKPGQVKKCLEVIHSQSTPNLRWLQVDLSTLLSRLDFLVENGHPLTAPNVRPLTRCFWTTTLKIKGTTIWRVAAAVIGPHAIPKTCMYPIRLTGTVSAFCCVSIRA